MTRRSGSNGGYPWRSWPGSAPDWLTAQASNLVFPPGSESIEACPVIGRIEPGDSLLIADVHAFLVTGDDVLGPVESADGQARLVHTMKPYGAAAHGTEATLNILRRSIAGRLASKPAHAPGREQDVGPERRTGMLSAHAAVTVTYPFRLRADFEPDLATQAPSSPVHINLPVSE